MQSNGRMVSVWSVCANRAALAPRSGSSSAAGERRGIGAARWHESRVYLGERRTPALMNECVCASECAEHYCERQAFFVCGLAGALVGRCVSSIDVCVLENYFICVIRNDILFSTLYSTWL